MSSMCSMPTDTRTRSGVTPLAFCSASLSCWCVVVLGWMTSVLASPTFARWLASFTLSMNLRPASRPPLIPKVRTEPKPFFRYFFASACEGCEGRLGWLTHVTAGCFSSHLTSSIALSLCRCTRSDSVSSPWRKRNELKGERHGP